MRVLIFLSIADLCLTWCSYVYFFLFFRFARRWWFVAIYCLLSLNIPVSRLLADFLPLEVVQYSAIVAGVWIASMYYTVLSGAVHLILYLFAKIFRKELPAKKLMFGLLGFCMVLCVYGGWLAFHPVVRNEYLATNKLPRGYHFKVVMISDVHLGRVLTADYADKIVKMINDCNPDVVIIAGDMLDERISYVTRFGSLDPFSRLRSPYGVYMVFGNHDYFDDLRHWGKLLWKNHIDVLSDSSRLVMGGKIKITGLADYSINRSDRDLVRLSKDNSSTFNILVDHQPRRISSAASAGYDLYLSGHTHTGQLWPNRLLTKWLFLSDYGRAEFGSMTAVVSGGIGFWGPPIRSSTAPEIVVIDVEGC